ncbi:MAG: hypothetical protein HRU29_01655 [Rhizobiales bacterium]|nr:hypothetical protein [Hyphomicrobiales bacterium]NRB13080.1 hypothetical protein [Hyphomicrobiales bacterium]
MMNIHKYFAGAIFISTFGYTFFAEILNQPDIIALASINMLMLGITLAAQQLIVADMKILKFYHQVSKHQPNMLNLHVAQQYFKATITCFVSNLFFLICHGLFGYTSFEIDQSYNFEINQLLASIIVGVSMVSVFFMLLNVQLFSHHFLISAHEKEKGVDK